MNSIKTITNQFFSNFNNHKNSHSTIFPKASVFSMLKLNIYPILLNCSFSTCLHCLCSNKIYSGRNCVEGEITFTISQSNHSVSIKTRRGACFLVSNVYNRTSFIKSEYYSFFKTCHRLVQYDQIMRWRCFNLGQGLLQA